MSLTDEDIANLKLWGTKIARLGVMWESVEYAPGQFNATYLEQVE